MTNFGSNQRFIWFLVNLGIVIAAVLFSYLTGNSDEHGIVTPIFINILGFLGLMAAIPINIILSRKASANFLNRLLTFILLTIPWCFLLAHPKASLNPLYQLLFPFAEKQLQRDWSISKNLAALGMITLRYVLVVLTNALPVCLIAIPPFLFFYKNQKPKN